MANSPEDRMRGSRTKRRPRVNIAGSLPAHEYKVLEGRFVKGMTLEESARHAGMEGNVSTMKVRAHQIIAKHQNGNSALIEAMQQVNINPDTIAEKIREGLGATMKVKRKISATEEELVDVPDFHAQHKFVESVLDITGSKAPKKIEIEQKTFEQRLLEITLRSE